MFDIHCHLLPSLDDGPRNMKDTVKLAEQAFNDGIDEAFVTPHYLEEKREPFFVSRFREEFERTKAELDARDIPLIIHPAAELFFYSSSSLMDCIEEPALRLGGTSYFLVELPMLDFPHDLQDALFLCRMEGYRPILAHPERNRRVVMNPDVLYSYVDNGILVQLDAESLTGGFGQSIRKTARKLLENNLVHFIGSDGHDAGKRPMVLSGAADVLGEWKLKDSIDILLKKNPGAILGRGEVSNTGFITHPVRSTGKNIFNRILNKLKGNRL